MRLRTASLWLLLLRQGQAWQQRAAVPVLSTSRLSNPQPLHRFPASTLPLRMVSTEQQHDAQHEEAAKAPDLDVAVLLKGRTAKQVWRPDKQDVERISWGKPAKKKGTGSRGVPHRLNQEERLLFDHARTKGFLEVAGSAWRSQRRDAPLLNTYRSWCDACAQVSIVLHKSSTGVDDAVVVDVSPLRLEEPAEFQAVAHSCLEQRPGGGIRSQGGSNIYDDEQLEDKEEDVANLLLLDSDAWETRPIYQLPPYCLVWESLGRGEAKELAKSMAKFCQTGIKTREKKSKKPVGVKPGKGRRHGGYGIG